ncbi:MAG: universal stress protein [Bryobacteraceae bacterium]
MHPVSIHKILAPVDFSRRAEGAVRSARRLAAHFDAELIVLHVMEPFHVDYAMVEPFEGSLRHLADENLAKKRAQLDAFLAHELEGVKVTRRIVEGDAAGEILQSSRRENTDLVVMPTQGRGRLHGLLIGSVTSKVLDESERPVLTGTHLEQDGGPNDWQFHNIHCAIDLGTRTGSVLGWGKAMAKEFGAKVTVLHVSSDPEAGSRVAKAVEAAGLQAETLIMEGEPHKLVSAAAEQLKADLVIIGRGTATSTLGRLRAQAYGIVRQAPCPVLSV